MINKAKASLPHLFQSHQWGQVLTYHAGVGAQMYKVLWKGTPHHVLVVRYPLLGGYWYGYIPRGPLGIHGDLSAFCAYMATQLPPKCAWIMVNPDMPDAVPLEGRLRLGHKEVFPPMTLRIDLRMSEEDILKQMKEKGRYNVRLAAKKGVQITGYQYATDGTLVCVLGDALGSDPIAAYGMLSKETTARDGFHGHPTGFYDHMLRVLENRSLLLLAHRDGVCLAGGIFAYDDSVFYYYYGASTSNQRELMAPYLLQWEAIRFAKAATPCLWYDFLGIARDVSNPSDPLYGVSQFKCKFGGMQVWTGQTYDFVCKPMVYRCIVLLKTLRSWLRR